MLLHYTTIIHYKNSALNNFIVVYQTRKYLDAWCVFFWAATPTLFSLCTFGLFILAGNQLDAATVLRNLFQLLSPFLSPLSGQLKFFLLLMLLLQVFTCLALFNILISPLNSFPWVINGLIDVSIS